MADTDHLKCFLSGVKPTGKNIGIGTYAKVFEVEFCGRSYAAKEIHATLTESMKQEGFEHGSYASSDLWFEKMKKVFIAECQHNCTLAHENLIRVLGLYDSGVTSVRARERISGVGDGANAVQPYVIG